MNNIFIYALISSVLVSIIVGLTGSFVVARRVSFISGGLSHAIFAGVGLGYLMNFNPVYGAILTVLLAAVLLGYTRTYMEQSEDSVIGITWALGMALGVLFLSMSSGYTPDVMGFIFGDILATSDFDLYFMAAIAAIVFVVIVFYYNEFIALSFDETFVKIQGKNVFFLNSLLFAIIGLTVVALVKAIGVVLVVSMLTIPASIVMMYLKDMKKIMFFNGLLTFVFSIIGITVSYFLDWGSTPAIIIPMVICYLGSIAYVRIRH